MPLSSFGPTLTHECLNWGPLSPPKPPNFSLVGLRYEAKASKQSTEIGSEQETETKGSSVEDHRSIDLDVERRCDHDGATPEARSRTVEKISTISSSTSYAAAFDEFVRRGEASKLITIFGGHIARG